MAVLAESILGLCSSIGSTAGARVVDLASVAILTESKEAESVSVALVWRIVRCLIQGWDIA